MLLKVVFTCNYTITDIDSVLALHCGRCKNCTADTI
jgi:hypothetical protein